MALAALVALVAGCAAGACKGAAFHLSWRSLGKSTSKRVLSWPFSPASIQRCLILIKCMKLIVIREKLSS